MDSEEALGTKFNFKYLVIRWNLFLPALEIEPPKKKIPPQGEGSYDQL